MEVGTDAYVSADDVSSYLTARGQETAWDAAEEDKQEAAIIEATSFLDAAFTWVGRIQSCDQPLGWPRFHAFDREGRRLEGIPTQVANACAELANLALGGRLQPMELASTEPAITMDRAGDIQVNYDNSIQQNPYDYVRMMLRGIGGYRSSKTGMNRLVRT